MVVWCEEGTMAVMPSHITAIEIEQECPSELEDPEAECQWIIRVYVVGMRVASARYVNKYETKRKALSALRKLAYAVSRE